MQLVWGPAAKGVILVDVSRRHFLAGGAGLAVTSPAFAQFSSPFVKVLQPSSQVLRPLTTTALASSYTSSLVSGYTPKYPTWLGQQWTAAMGSTWNTSMDYSWRYTAHKARFELHPTTKDRAYNDPSDKRRSELHDKKHLLTNGVVYWGAFSFIDQAWSDPTGMAKTTGGSIFQMHMPSGGSPAFAFRRDKNGAFIITTNGANDPTNNHKWYSQTLAFNQVHDIVYRCVIHPTNGSLDVWVDGRQVLSLTRQSIGVSSSGCYPCYGLYYAGGITCTIAAEIANIAAPSTLSLSSRTLTKPVWPSS